MRFVMGKTNYTKVEEALAEGMRKMEVDKLLQATENSAKTQAGEKVDSVHLQRLKKIDLDLKTLEKQGKKPYAYFKIKPEEIKQFLKNPTLLTPQDWEKIKSIKEQITIYKGELEKVKLESIDDEIITKEVKKQKTKRFNINEKWIPLR
jgi:hypothetical protein